MDLEESSDKGQEFLVQALETNSVENGVGESQVQFLGGAEHSLGLAAQHRGLLF